MLSRLGGGCEVVGCPTTYTWEDPCSPLSVGHRQRILLQTPEIGAPLLAISVRGCLDSWSWISTASHRYGSILQKLCIGILVRRWDGISHLWFILLRLLNLLREHVERVHYLFRCFVSRCGWNQLRGNSLRRSRCSMNGNRILVAVFFLTILFCCQGPFINRIFWPSVPINHILSSTVLQPSSSQASLQYSPYPTTTPPPSS